MITNIGFIQLNQVVHACHFPTWAWKMIQQQREEEEQRYLQTHKNVGTSRCPLLHHTVGHPLAAMPNKNIIHNYEIAEKSPKHQLEANMTENAVITLWELLSKCQTITFFITNSIDELPWLHTDFISSKWLVGVYKHITIHEIAEKPPEWQSEHNMTTSAVIALWERDAHKVSEHHFLHHK